LILLADLIYLLQTAEDLAHRHAENQQISNWHNTLHHHDGAGGKEGELAGGGDAADDRDEVAPQADGGHDLIEVLVGIGVIFGDFRVLGGKGLDDLDAGDVLVTTVTTSSPAFIWACWAGCIFLLNLRIYQVQKGTGTRARRAIQGLRERMRIIFPMTKVTISIVKMRPTCRNARMFWRSEKALFMRAPLLWAS